MLRSMTGFGSISKTTKSKTITCEIKSLNSKGLDFSIRIPSAFKDEEQDLRRSIGKILQRGKISLSVKVELINGEQPIEINDQLALQYHKQLSKLAKKLGANGDDLFRLTLQMPDVLRQPKEERSTKEWTAINPVIKSAVRDLVKFREKEGGLIAIDLKKSIKIILQLLKKIEQQEPKRTNAYRSRLKKQVRSSFDKKELDSVRFEQELIYFMEKIDITEEKNRLRSHCKFFTDTLKTNIANGKKLGFISQEIGREINTLGSKANDSKIQHLVVQMKDELEKVKEQVMNVL